MFTLPTPRSLLTIALSAAAAIVPLVTAAPAAAVPTGSTVLVDRPTGFGALPFDGAGDSRSAAHAISADGRYVVFGSESDALIDTDDDSSDHIYRLDRSTGHIDQADTTSTGAQPQSRAFDGEASISADGRYIAFTSSATNYVPGVPEAGVYVKDMNTGQVVLASRGTGAQGAPAGEFPQGVISGDGRHVAFVASGPLHADNADGVANQDDAYVRSLDANTTHMVSVTDGGAEAGGVQGTVPIDIDFTGADVAFVTTAQLSRGDTDADQDLYLRTAIEQRDEETCFVSFTTGQTPGADGADSVTLSSDGIDIAWGSGRGVFFSQIASSAAGQATRVDIPQRGVSFDGIDADAPAFSANAAADELPTRLYFRTASRLSPFDDNNSDDVYDTTVSSLANPDGIELDTDGSSHGDIAPPSGTADASAVVYASDALDLPGPVRRGTQVYLRAARTDRNISQPLNRAPRTDDAGDAFIESRAVSDDGRAVAFTSDAPALGSVDPQEAVDQVLVRDVVTGQTTLVSAQSDGSPGDDDSGTATIDAAGDRVAFVSDALRLLPAGNPTGGEHVYVRDLQTHAITLVDRNAQGKPLDGGASGAQISADGHHLVYRSASADAPGAPPAGHTHAYLVDLTTGATTLVDRATDGSPGNGTVDGADVDGDGSRVAFTSEATNLGAAGSPGEQIFVRDIAAHTTLWASVPQDGNAQHAHAEDPSLSRSGASVAFDQSAPGFGFGMHGSTQAFVRNLATQATTLVSVVPGAANAEAVEPSLSADGQRVTFAAAPPSVGASLGAAVVGPAVALSSPADSTATAGIFLRDLGAGTTALVSARPDGSGAGPADEDFEASLDGTGSCVAFTSLSGSALTDPAYGPDFEHVYLRAVDDPCPGMNPKPAPTAPVVVTPPGATAPPPASPSLVPAIAKASFSPATFAVAAGPTATAARARHRKVARGTSLHLTTNVTGTLTVALTRTVVEHGKACGAKKKRTARCTKHVAEGSLTRRALAAGAHRIAFTGRVGHRALTRGSQRASLVLTAVGGRRSKTVTVAFTVVGS